MHENVMKRSVMEFSCIAISSTLMIIFNTRERIEKVYASSKVYIKLIY
jgi:hypothetical protein